MLHMYVTIHPTHKEIHYDSISDVEALMMVLSTYDNIRYEYSRFVYHLDEETNTLFIPSGISDEFIQNYLPGFNLQTRTYQPNNFRFMSKKYEIPSGFSLRDNLQRLSVNFLVGMSTYKNSRIFNKKVLVLPTGSGKTVICSLSGILMMRKTLIVCPNDNIRNEWVKTLRDIYKVDESKIFSFSSSDIDRLCTEVLDYDFFLVLHQSLQSIIRKHGIKSLDIFASTQGIGLKIVDEVHLFPLSTFQLDYFTNIDKSIYITATFDRSDKNEKKLFKMSFKDAMILDQRSKDYKEADSTVIHTKYYHVLYDSHCSEYIVKSYLVKQSGFNVCNFTTYAMYKDPKYTLAKILLKVVRDNYKKGKMLILASTKEAVKTIKELLDTMFNNNVSVGVVLSGTKNKEEEFQKQIIVSTSKSSGTGVDIHGLVTLVNTEAYGNEIFTNQLRGRLRYRGDNKVTYMYDLVDISIKPAEILGKKRLNELQKICLSVDILDYTKIDLDGKIMRDY